MKKYLSPILIVGLGMWVVMLTIELRRRPRLPAAGSSARSLKGGAIERAAKTPLPPPDASEDVKAAYKHLGEVHEILGQIRTKEQNLQTLTEALQREDEIEQNAAIPRKSSTKKAKVTDGCNVRSLSGVRECLAEQVRNWTDFSENVAGETETTPKE